jgi:autotransporter-associated beta strand protein
VNAGYQKLGDGVLKIGGTQANSYRGLTDVKAGFVELQKPARVAAIGGNLDISGGTVLLRSGEQIVDSATVAITAGRLDLGSHGERVRSLNIAPGGALDVNTGGVVIDYTTGGDSIAASVRAQIADGRIFTSSAVPGMGVGYAQTGEVGITDFLEVQGVDATSLLVQRTWLGDANLDGRVDIVDLGKVASNWQAPSLWIDGDFNYDGFFGISDLGMLASNWQAEDFDSDLRAASLTKALATYGIPATNVPEPIVAIPALAMLAFRRHLERRVVLRRV